MPEAYTVRDDNKDIHAAATMIQIVTRLEAAHLDFGLKNFELDPRAHSECSKRIAKHFSHEAGKKQMTCVLSRDPVLQEAKQHSCSKRPPLRDHDYSHLL